MPSLFDPTYESPAIRTARLNRTLLDAAHHLVLVWRRSSQSPHALHMYLVDLERRVDDLLADIEQQERIRPEPIPPKL